MSLDPALVAFCRKEHPRLVGFMSLYCGDALLAEELAQETLARACRDWRKVTRLHRPEAWATRVAFNLANSHFRRKRYERRARERLESRLVGVTEPPDAAAELALRKALAALPPRQKPSARHQTRPNRRARPCCRTLEASAVVSWVIPRGERGILPNKWSTPTD